MSVRSDASTISVSASVWRTKPPSASSSNHASTALDSDAGATTRWLGWTALGVGALGVGTSAVTGVIALGAKSDLDAACRPGCPASAQGDIDTFRTQRTLSYVSLGIGAVALGVGGYLLLGESGESPRVGALLTPNSAAFAGVF